jgi:transposase
MLAAYDIEVALLIVDAGYASMENLSKLTSTNIFFLTRMPQNRKEFKKFVSDNEANLRDGAIFINYKNRTLFWKDVNKCE